MSHTELLVLHCLTPLHVGTGRGEGIIDLPVSRDVVTQHPLVPGSGIKGPLRAAADEDDRTAVFGPDTSHAHEHASAVRFSDARLVAMPIASDAGTFAWATSPLVLARMLRDAPGGTGAPASIPGADKNEALFGPDEVLISDGQIILDGVEYMPKPAGAHAPWFTWLSELVFGGDSTWRGLFEQRLVILHDEAFDQIARTGTDVRAHIRIDPDKGTVKDGALWYEESVPAESVFVGLVQAVGNRHVDADAALAVVRAIVDAGFTLGGGKTTGMGRVRGRLVGTER